MYPGRQAQVKSPGVLVQLALALQPPLFLEHSSISETSQTSAMSSTTNIGHETAISCAEFYHLFQFTGKDREICVRGPYRLASRPSSFLHFNPPPLLLRSKRIKPVIRGSVVSSPAESGAELGPKTNLVHSNAVRKPLVAIIFTALH